MSEVDLVKHGGEVVERPAGEVEQLGGLPAVPVVGELVPTRPLLRARVVMVGTIARRPVHVITTLAGGPRPRAAALATARVGMTTAAGVRSWWRRAHSVATHGAHRRALAAAEKSGDREATAKALDALEKAKDGRAKRLRELPGTVFGLLRMLAVVAVLAAAALVVLGVLVWISPGGWGWSDWWDGVFGLAEAVGNLLFLATAAATWAALPALVLAAWLEGRRAEGLPGWLRTAADSDVDVTIDERAVTQALAALRMPEIRDYLKGGQQLQYLVPCRTDGRGTFCRLRLPVPAEQIAKPERRAKVATHLYRSTKEVWPTVGDEAGILDLWIADKGALAEGAGDYPLLDEGFTDVFKGVPFGKTLRGAPLMAPLMERNTIVGGMPGQGKSAAARVIMAGAALDITAELRIWVPDSNFDFEAFRPRCSRYVMGAETEKIEEILEDLRDLHREVQARGDLLVRYEIPAVTREYASRGVGLHPLFCLLEEAHVAFQHPLYGPEICSLYVDIVRLGRKRGIHMVPSTQAPTKDSMPRDITRNCTNGVAFAVGDHVANDALLGQGAYRAGHRATELIPGTDRGVCVVKGFTGERSDIVQVYFLDVEKGNDQVSPIIDRSLDAIARAGKAVPGTEPRDLAAERDLLEDLEAVLGSEPTKSADCPALLAAYAPGWAPYKSMTGKSLRARLLRDYKIKVPSTDNRWLIDPAVIRSALAERSTADLDDEG